MKTLRVALLQLLPAGMPDENAQKGAAACRRAKAMGADIALFSEMWSNGYCIPEDIRALQARPTATATRRHLMALRICQTQPIPGQYGLLLEERVQAPFVPADSRRSIEVSACSVY